MNNTKKKNAVVIGAGPAGITAAVYIKRAGFDVTVVSKYGGSLLKADKIENFYGFPTPVSGKELYEGGIENAKRLGVKFIDDEVVNLGFSEGFTVFSLKNELSADAVIIATGSKRKTPKIGGLKELEGRGVSYCAVCDAFFHRNKPVAVLGNSDYALHEAGELINIAKSVTLLTNGDAPQFTEAPEFNSEKFEINTKKIAFLSGSDLLESVAFKDGSSLPVSGLFIAIGVAGGTELAKKTGMLTEGDYISVGKDCETNIPGIFAAGDCTGGPLQISKAVCDGMNAALSAVNFLKKQP